MHGACPAFGLIGRTEREGTVPTISGVGGGEGVVRVADRGGIVRACTYTSTALAFSLQVPVQTGRGDAHRHALASRQLAGAFRVWASERTSPQMCGALSDR